MKLDNIATFFDKDKYIAIAGVSGNVKKFGGQLYKSLKEKGYKVIPINPNTNNIGDDVCYKSIALLPDGVDRLIIVTPPNKTDMLLYEASIKGITYVWVQQMSETKETKNIAEQLQIEVILKHCVFMFAQPVQGIHKFHKGILRFFGALPK